MSQMSILIIKLCGRDTKEQSQIQNSLEQLEVHVCNGNFITPYPKVLIFLALLIV